jgi:predicted O-methyltransferase YrrM
MIKKIVKKTFPGVASQVALRRSLAIWKKSFWPPGHYYSPIPDEKDITGEPVDYNTTIPGVDLNESAQLQLLERLKLHYSNNLFPAHKAATNRYYFDNDYFGYSDGISLYTIIREFKPCRIIEVGSGFSSALMLDTNEKYFGNRIRLTFVEPYPEERLLKLVSQNDNCVVVKDFVQNVGFEVWDELGEKDILFIDSSHVTKYKSDINYLFFKILPRLKPGVIIHVHDVFYPFEYPWEWLAIGRAWNEAYLLRSFLQFNSDFEIIYFNSFMEGKYKSWYAENMPQCLTIHKLITVNGETRKINTTGQSIYLRRK